MHRKVPQERNFEHLMEQAVHVPERPLHAEEVHVPIMQVQKYAVDRSVELAIGMPRSDDSGITCRRFLS